MKLAIIARNAANRKVKAATISFIKKYNELENGMEEVIRMTFFSYGENNLEI